MLNQETATIVIARNRIDQAIARARRERDAEVARLLGLAFASVRAAITRSIQRAGAAIRAAVVSGNAHHA